MKPEEFVKAREEVLKLIAHEEQQIELISTENHTEDLKKLFVTAHKQNIEAFHVLLNKYYSN